MQDCRLSIILPVHGKQADLDLFLESLSQNTIDDSWELIVVDDGSKEALSLGNKPYSQWTILREHESVGAARARNVGAKKAKGEHLVFLSLFLSLPKNYIGDMVSFISGSNHDYAQHLLFSENSKDMTNFQKFISDQGSRINTDKKSLNIKNCQFAAASIKRELFLRFDGFDNTMQHYGGHELDLIYRLDQEGFQHRILIETIPLKRINYEAHQKTHRRLVEYGERGIPSLLKKHPELEVVLFSQPFIWKSMSILGFTRLLEQWIYKKIELDKALNRLIYRLYLHLLVRNAWDAR